MGLDLKQFMELVDARPVDVSRATGLAESIITRTRDKKTKPTGMTLLLLSNWAEAQARLRKLRKEQQLSWDAHLGDAA